VRVTVTKLLSDVRVAVGAGFAVVWVTVAMLMSDICVAARERVHRRVGDQCYVGE
jgi:hypothetical protein